MRRFPRPPLAVVGLLLLSSLRTEAAEPDPQLLNYAQKLGTVGFETDYGPNDFRFDMTWKRK